MLILSHELSYGDTPTYYRNYFERQWQDGHNVIDIIFL